MEVYAIDPASIARSHLAAYMALSATFLACAAAVGGLGKKGWWVAICAALLLVVDVLFSLALAWVTTGALAVLLIWWWLAVPLWKRARNEQDEVPDE
jgi:hypothetical protein